MINTFVLCWIRSSTLCWHHVLFTESLETLKWKGFSFFFCSDKVFNNQFQQLQGTELVTQSSDL